MPDIAWNRKVWTDYSWPKDGEEWSAEMAAFCGVTPEVWKDSVVREFLIPHLRKDKAVVEIGPGHGRWSAEIAPRVWLLYLVDISEACLDFCKKRFADRTNIVYCANGESIEGKGATLKHLRVPCVLTGHFSFISCDEKNTNEERDAAMAGTYWTATLKPELVDFIFSFDTFVHIEEPETRAYAKEFARVLKRQAMGVIHHAGNPTAAQRANGCRSLVTASQFKKILAENGLVVIRQTDSWGDGKCNVKMAADMITAFIKP